MITLEEYFGPKITHPDASPDVVKNGEALLGKVNALLAAAEEGCGYAWEKSPNTGTCISGSKGGAGDGGFRLGVSKTGATNSKHKTGHAVDVYDPGNRIDGWLTNDLLEDYGLYREAPEDTPGWCHLQDLPPGSGRRTFKP